MKFGKLKKLSLRDVWKNEARDFTPWLADNLDVLGETLGMELETQGTETGVGDFSLDLLAKDLGTGHTVIIENQLNPTDHDHLGKLLTYAAGYSASAVVWIAENIRDEHKEVMEWLNQRTDEETLFFAVTIEVFKIDDSNPTYSLKPVVAPSEWQKTRKRQVSGTLSPKAEMYRDYFQKLIDELREQHHFTNARIGQPQNWYAFSTGFSGINYGAVFGKENKVRTELYIDVSDKDSNKALFDWLYSKQEEIHSNYGEELVWERLDDGKSSRIAIYREGSIESEESDIQSIKQWHIENLLRFKKVFKRYLKDGLREVIKPS